MKQITLPSTILKFTRLVIHGFMEENGRALNLPKWKLGPSQYRRSQEIWNFPSHLLQDAKCFSSPNKKKCVGGWIYTIKNKDNTDQRKVVWAGEKHCEKHFFSLRFVFTIFYTGSFQVPPEKLLPSKKPIPTQNPNFT